jgi:hypothetical protein
MTRERKGDESKALRLVALAWVSRMFLWAKAGSWEQSRSRSFQQPAMRAARNYFVPFVPFAVFVAIEPMLAAEPLP